MTYVDSGSINLSAIFFVIRYLQPCFIYNLPCLGKNTDGANVGHRRRSSEGHSFDWLEGNTSTDAVRINKQSDIKRNGKSKSKNQPRDHSTRSSENVNRANNVNNNDTAFDNSGHQLTDTASKKSPILRSKSTSFEPDVKLLNQNEDESITQTVTRSLMSAISREVSL